MTEHRHTNRLAHETSPYLLQHAHNPVDWYPWGEEAFARARGRGQADPPLGRLLGLPLVPRDGARVLRERGHRGLMNGLFVNIKVDREERPDVDQIYMQAVQSMTGHGGWPMTVFLTPDGVPFYGGTYFPPVDRHGMPGFPALARSPSPTPTARARRGGGVRPQAPRADAPGRAAPASPTLLSDDILPRRLSGHRGSIRRAARRLRAGAEVPAADDLGVPAALLASARAIRARSTWCGRTLDAMARGGMYDQVGGGFHRYSVDAQWLVPHFEKMLYDNAQLASLYLHALARHRRPEYRRIAEETLDYVLRRCDTRRAASSPPRTPTPRARRGSSSSGRPTRSRGARRRRDDRGRPSPTGA